MKTVISISLGSDSFDYDFKTEFMGQQFRVARFGCNNDMSRAKKLIKEWRGRCDAIGLGMVKDHYLVGTHRFVQKSTKQLEDLVSDIPVTTGATLRSILNDWGIRHIQMRLDNFLNNAKVLFFSGTANYGAASVMAEYTDSLFFADPLVEFGVPKLLTSLGSLERYAAGVDYMSQWKQPHAMSHSIVPLEDWSHFILCKALQKAHVIVGPYEQIEKFGLEELGGKTVLTSTISEERLEALGDKGVDIVVDYCPQLFDVTVGINVIEAMILAATEKQPDEITHDDYLEIIDNLQIEPTVLYPNGEERVHRFAFVIHPLSQKYLTNTKPIEMLDKVAPKPVMNMVEKMIAYAPPFLYSRVTGIKSPTGARTEGWLISVGGTPKEIMSHSPEFTYRRLLAAAEMAKRMGAQIMGLGAFTKVVGDAGVTVAKRAPLPVTTGNSYSASGALWAAHEALLKLGLVSVGKNGKMKGKAMVVGATGAIGSVCARLLAKAVDELYMVSPETAKLLALKESIELESPGTKIHLMSYADKNLDKMDMIVTATSGAGKKILDIMDVKPGCVITDVARPLDIPASDVARRPDVLVIESGEIELPGDVKMKEIGLPKNVVYACLAETIVLALEGKFENFTLGRNIEWEKVREIYKLGLKHGMKLASISGINGVYSEDDLANVRKLALKKLNKNKNKKEAPKRVTH